MLMLMYTSASPKLRTTGARARVSRRQMERIGDFRPIRYKEGVCESYVTQ